VRTPWETIRIQSPSGMLAAAVLEVDFSS
jgi:hypothetical protein